MATRQDERMVEPEMNPQDLWLEEIFTDRRVGTIRRMTPVDGKGERDAAADHLLEIIRRDRKWNDEAARKQLLQLFEAWGLMDPASVVARRKLSGIWF